MTTTTTTVRQKIDRILNDEFFKPYKIPVTYKVSDYIIYEITKSIDELSQSAGKGFCLRTANRIKNKINDNGIPVAKEPKS